MVRYSVLLLLAFPFTSWAAPKVTLAGQGKALLPIITAEKATPATKAKAATLADYLKRITGATFEIRTGDGTQGIALGRSDDFPAIKHGVAFAPKESTRREEYLLRSHAQGLWLIGATDLAVQHAVWDLLHRIGYRHYFPSAAWEVVPTHQQLSIDIDTLEKPSYHSRRIWYGFGAWDHAKQPYAEWCERNRCLSGLVLNTGHAYDGIVKALQKDFDAHPEYWPQLNGERKPVRNPKPCLSNAELRSLIIKHVVSRMDKDPTLDSVSIDPSDGGGWCECERCAKMGSVSDQAIILANELAAELEKKHPGKKVGLYAYNYHSAPPHVRVHPNVVVSVATAFIKGGQSLDDIVVGWAKKEAVLGIREYYSVNTWDRDQPGHARGGNIGYLTRTIPEFYAQGARYMSAESSDNWGPNGLGYYLASRLLWNVNESKNVDALIDDFLRTCFGTAHDIMREYYAQIDSGKPHLVTDDQLGRMYRALSQARERTTEPAIHRRLDELTLYARYSTLYHRYATTDGKDRQPAFEALIKHAYRMRSTMLVHTYALYRDLASRDKSVLIPTEAKWQVPEGKNPWKSSEPYKQAELQAFMKEGLASHKLVNLDFKPIDYSSDLLPATSKFTVPKDLPAGELGAGRGVQTFFTYADKATTLELGITGGLIAHYRDRGNVKVELWKIGGASATGERETLVSTDRTTPPDGKEYPVKLAIKEAGLYKVTVSDGNDRTAVKWPTTAPLNWRSTQDAPMNGTYGQWMGYFYVPKGTKVIGFFGGEHGEIRDSADRPHFWLNGRQANFYSVTVPEGQDGKIWKVRYVRGPLRLLTVPPYFARTPQELLLPREVLPKDAN